MGTTIEDILQQEAEEKNYLREQLEDEIRSRRNSYTEGAEKILNYLPINKNPLESEYVEYLWDAFTTLNGLSESSQGFSVMPFHLLFMLSLQYKVMRIIKNYEKECLLVFSAVGGRDKIKLLNPARSVFDLGCLNERTLPELLQLLDIDKELIKRIKDLVDYRNDALAHPKGGKVPDYESRIEGYTELLEIIQPMFLPLNDLVAEKWLSEMESGEAVVEYMELHLAEEYLCPADVHSGKLKDLDRRLNG